MFKYQNCNCPYCENPLLETDDLAVCPECGTPHHRACYKEQGKCANDSNHKDGIEWVSPILQSQELAKQTNKTACLNCGSLNELNTNFCNQCGAPVPTAHKLPAYGSNNNYHQPQLEPSDVSYELEQAVNTNQKIDGFSIRDWMSYISSSVGYYLYCFKMQDTTGKKLSFTWSAMMFPVLYFMYRKVYWAAAVAFVLNFLFRIPLTISLYFVPSGYNFGLSVGFWDMAANIFSLITIAVNLCWGLYAVYFYRKSSLKRMSILRKKCQTEQEFSSRLLKISGPSVIAVLMIVVPYTLLTLVGLWLPLITK